MAKADTKLHRNVSCHNILLPINKSPEPEMDSSDPRNRKKRKLPTHMYGATLPRDDIGPGGPAYGGALEWLRKHQEYLNQSIRYVQRYPNLIQDKIMDPFWDFLEPLVYNNNLLNKYDEFLKTQFGFNENYLIQDKFGQQLPTAATYFQKDTEQRRTDYTYPVRRVFFCYDRTSSHHQSLKHLIVDQLEPFVCVRTNPTPEQAKAVNSLDICRAICGSTFIMLINDTLLQDQICLNLLSIAIAYKTPIIFLRESGYVLPAEIADTKIDFVRPPTNSPFVPTNQGVILENTGRPAVHNKKSVPNKTGDQSLKTLNDKVAAKESDAERSTSLSKMIRELYADSLVFNANIYESTLNMLYDKVASYTGAAFSSSVPQQAIDDATQLTRMFNVASLKLSDRPIYRAGSARTTRGFHQTLQAQNQQLYNNVNNNAVFTPSAAVTDADVRICRSEAMSAGSISHTGSYSDDSGILSSDVPADELTVTYKTFTSTRKAEPNQEGFTHATFMPSPPKVMRSSNLQGKFTDVSKANGFRPNYPSNSKLLRYRPNSSRPSSGRSRVLLQTSLHANGVDDEEPCE